MNASTLRVNFRRMTAALALAIGAAAMPLGVGSAVAFGTSGAAAQQAQPEDNGIDQIIMKDGRVIEGKIIEETDRKVHILVIYAGLEAPSFFDKDEILRIERNVRDGEAVADEGESDAGTGSLPTREPETEYAPREARERPLVYMMELRGETGSDIHPTPMRDAVADARKYEPDYLIVKLDNEWSFFGGDEAPDDAQVSFDAYAVVEEMEPIFRTEIDQTWERRPEIVFWVRNAMGGICMLPFVADSIYFHPEGRMGGIGTLDDLLDGVGDEVFRQKQRSLRLARAQGIAIAGGYDYRLVTAFARKSYVLSYRIGGNGVELLERMPEPGTREFLLTDDGEGDNEDTLVASVRGETNDTLTLREQTAQQIGLSSGTAETISELLTEIGILRNHDMVEGASDRIFENWSDSRQRAERRLPELWEKFQEAEANGADARRAIGVRISALEDILSIVNRFGQALDVQFLAQRGFPPNMLNPGQLRVSIEVEKIRLVAARR